MDLGCFWDTFSYFGRAGVGASRRLGSGIREPGLYRHLADVVTAGSFVPAARSSFHASPSRVL